MTNSDNPLLVSKTELKNYRIQWPHDKPIRLANRMAVAERSNLIALAGKRYGIHLYSISTRNYVDQFIDRDDPEHDKDYPSNRGVYALAFTPDERFLISGDEASQIKIWDVKQRRLVKNLNAQAGRINSLSISSDGHRIAVACESGAVQIWDLSTYKKLRTHLGLPSKNNNPPISTDQVALIPNQGRLVISAGGFIHWWDYNKEDSWHRFEGQKVAVYYRFTLSNSGKFLSASELLWDLHSGKTTAFLRYHNKGDYGISSTFFSRDEKLLFANDSDGRLLVYDPQSGSKKWNIHWSPSSFGGSNSHIKILTDNPTVISFTPFTQSNLNTVRFRDLNTGKERLPEQAIRIRAPRLEKTKLVSPRPVMLSSDGQFIVTGNIVRSTKTLEVIRKIDMPDVNLIHRGLKSVAISNDNRLLAACAHTKSERYIAIWEVGSGKRLQKIANQCQQVMFSADAKSILIVNEGLLVRKMDVVTGKIQFTIDQYKYISNTKDDEPRSLRIISFSKQLVLTVNTKFQHGYIALHNGKTGQQQRVIRDREINHIRTSAVSKYLTYAALVTSVAGDTSTLKIIVYLLSDGKIILQAPMQSPCCYRVAFSPDNQQLYVATMDNLLRSWNLSSGKQHPPLRYGWERTFVSQYDNLFISPDGQRLYFGGLIWDLRTRRQIRIPN